MDSSALALAELGYVSFVPFSFFSHEPSRFLLYSRLASRLLYLAGLL
ncbi:hypothetical protein B488_06760 [Liberibacter crescens BT-1]|uniref:Uncharacterized protein n=1 Tax=Liberibacter crescens (strain BT-1) TaxID=1215343 RepID=L0EVH9_LIBCB|nr:hypothetical protein [Liberibacter crescens]AGA64668.1 hypothetical protein B488_06760 [Liberibacter crescens BT-1]